MLSSNLKRLKTNLAFVNTNKNSKKPIKKNNLNSNLEEQFRTEKKYETLEKLLYKFISM